MNGLLLGTLEPRALDARVVLWPLLLGLGVYLLLLSQSWLRQPPDLGERLRLMDADARLNDALQRRAAPGPLFSSKMLENKLRPVVDDAGRLAQGLLVRLGMVGGEQFEQRLRVARPGVEPVQFVGEKVADGLLLSGVSVMNVLHIEPFDWLCGCGWDWRQLLLPDWDRVGAPRCAAG
jgi:hypothetical protein